MEFSINTETLKREVNLLQNIADKKSGIGALASLLIESTEKGIKLTGTDLDTTLQSEVEATIKTEGSICVPAKKLCDVVKSLDSGTITFKKEKTDWVQLKCNTSKFRMAGIAREHFPQIPEVADTEVTVDGESFKALIKHTCFAMTNEESRFSLNGAKLEVSHGKITMTATDGHRIATMEDDIDDIEAELDVLVPKIALSEVVKFLGNEVVITQDTNNIKFVSDNRVLISRKLAPNFPAYKQALPKDNTVQISFSAEEMVKSLRRNAIMADERVGAVKLDIKKDKMILSSGTGENSEEEVVSTSMNLPEEGLTVHLNWVYLVDYLMICDKPVLKLKDALSAVELVDSTSRYIVMPLRASA